MTKQEYIAGLEKLGLPKSEFVILSGGSLLMHGLRESTADFDLSASKALAEQIGLYACPQDENGWYEPFENVQMRDDYENFSFDLIDGYQCETLESVLAFKRRLRRPKDLRDIEALESFLTARDAQK